MRALLPIAVDVLTLLSLVLLSIPAWHINHYAKLAAELSSLRVEIKMASLAERHRKLRAKIDQLRDEWKPWKAWCLFLGTIAGALAAVLSMLDHWLTYCAEHHRVC